MSLRTYLMGLALATLLAWVCLIAILSIFDPIHGGDSILILFYLSLFVSSTGTFALISLAVNKIGKKKLPVSQVESSFRRAILLGIVLIVILILQSWHLMVWWTLLSLLAIVFLIEWLVSRR